MNEREKLIGGISKILKIAIQHKDLADIAKFIEQDRLLTILEGRLIEHKKICKCRSWMFKHLSGCKEWIELNRELQHRSG